MFHYKIHKLTPVLGGLSGAISVPPSKSHTLRAILFASIAEGESVIRHYLESPDTTAMILACRQIGAKIDIFSGYLKIKGMAGQPQQPDDVINVGNSGQVLRFVGAICALIGEQGTAVLTGDASIRHNRPIKPLMDALNQLGARCESLRGDHFSPMLLKGRIQPGIVQMDGSDSQPVSAMLIASAFLKSSHASHTSHVMKKSQCVEIKVSNAGEKSWIALTLDWFDRLNLNYENVNAQFDHYIVPTHQHIQGFEYVVPTDFSALAYPLVAAMISQSEITIEYVDMSDSQGDKGLIEVLQSLGANIQYDVRKQSLSVLKKHAFEANEVPVIDVNAFIDAVPILAVLGCFLPKGLRIENAAIARNKESDRLAVMTDMLRKMNAKIEEFPDGLLIYHSFLRAPEKPLYSHHDHRIAMALSVAALMVSGSKVTIIEDVDCVNKSFPKFDKIMQSIGASCLLEGS